MQFQSYHVLIFVCVYHFAKLSSKKIALNFITYFYFFVQNKFFKKISVIKVARLFLFVVDSQ